MSPLSIVASFFPIRAVNMKRGEGISTRSEHREESDLVGNSVLHNLLVQAHQVSDQINSAFQKIGVSLPLARALQFVAMAENSVTPSELAEELGRSPAATSSLIKRLMGDESVLVTVDSDDRRSFRITITEQGLAKWRQVEPVLKEVEATVNGDYGVARLKALAADMGDLKTSVQSRIG